MNKVFTITILLLFSVNFSHANQTWTTPDGFLSVEIPSSEQFDSIPNPPEPSLALWSSKDQTRNFGVLMFEVPDQFTPIQSSLEEGFANELGGEVKGFPTKTVSGFKVWRMMAEGDYGKMYQFLVFNGTSAYKIMAFEGPEAPTTESAVSFINSLTIHQIPSPQPSTELYNHELSKTLGGVGFILLILIVILRQFQKKKTEE